MVVIYEATGMTITYFTQSAKEDENFPIMHDFVTWLLLQYNLEFKVIRSNNKMNCIKTKKWYNSVGIFLKLSVLDIYMQNRGVERFGQLVMEKTRAMRLSVNLLYKLWRKIVAAATYLYNQTPQVLKNWMSPYEAFHTYVSGKEEVSDPYKSHLHHLKTYGCKAYMFINSKSDTQYRHKC